MRGWWQDLTDLVLPAECGGCGRPRTVLCPECRAVLSGSAPRRVRPEPEPTGLPAVHAAARYADEVRAALLAHKERGALALATPLGAALAGAVRAGLQEAWAGAPADGCGAMTGAAEGPLRSGWGSPRAEWGRVAGSGWSGGEPAVAGSAPGGPTGGDGRGAVEAGRAGAVAGTEGWGLADSVVGRAGDPAGAGGWGARGAVAGRGGGPGAMGGRGPAEAWGRRGCGSAGTGAGRADGSAGTGGRGLLGAGAERGAGSAGAGGRERADAGAGLVGGAAGFDGAAVGLGAGLVGDSSGLVSAGGARGVRAGGRDTAVLLVPVPSARRAVAARGHDPARRIALAAAGELRRGGVPARVVAVLRQRRGVADQAGLNSRERLDNLVGALAVAPGGARLLLGGPVVLVDDLMTTGASLAEAARAVRAATAEAVVTGRAARSSAYGSGETAVYETAARESMGARRSGPAEAGVGGGPGMAGGHRAGDVICAAVVAASPDSFEMNRN